MCPHHCVFGLFDDPVLLPISGNRGGVVTRQLMVTNRCCCRLYHGCGGNRSKLVSETVMSRNSSSCMVKRMGVVLVGELLVCLVLGLVWLRCGSGWWGLVMLEGRGTAFRFVRWQRVHHCIERCGLVDAVFEVFCCGNDAVSGGRGLQVDCAVVE